MHKNGTPWPDITRFPGERKLEGPPKQRQESVFAERGVADAANLSVDTVDMNSDARRRYMSEFLAGLSEEGRQQLLDGLSVYSNHEINKSQRLRNQSNYMIRLLKDNEPKRPLQAWELNVELDKEIVDIIAAKDGEENDPFTDFVNEVSEYINTPKHRRDALLTSRMNSLMDEPLQVWLKFVELDSFGGSDTHFHTQVADYRAHLTQRLHDMAGKNYLELPNSKQLYEWLCLSALKEESLASKDAQTIAQSHLASFITRCRSANESIDVVYEFVKAGFINGNKEVIRHTLDILYGETSILSIDSSSLMDVWLGTAVATGDSRSKAYEIALARQQMLSMNPTLIGAAVKKAAKIRRSRSYQEHLIQRRQEKIAIVGYQQYERDLHETKEELMNAKRRLKAVSPVRLSRMQDSKGGDELRGVRGPIIEHIDEIKHALQGRKFNPKRVEVGLFVTGESRYVKGTSNELSRSIRELCAQGVGQELVERKNWGTIAYLLPENISRKQIRALEEANRKLRAQIKAGQVHTLSPRGDQIEITDSLLTDLGVSSIQYNMNSVDKTQTEVVVEIGKLRYRAELDSEHRLVALGGKYLYLPEAGAFIEHVILSHLTEILCTDNVGEVSEEGDLIKERKAFATRRAHRRVLQEGEKPTPKQIVKILREYGIDLRRRNQERLAQGETTLITWVSQVDAISLAGKGAVVSKAPKATATLHRVLGK